MKKLFISIVRKLTSFAWQNEIVSMEGIALLEELHAVPGRLEAEIKLRPAMSQYIALCFADMIAKSENYTEATFKPKTVEANGKYEWITVLVQKGSGKTPHELRREAEHKEQLAIAESNRITGMLQDVRELLHHAYIHNAYQDLGFMQMTTKQKKSFVDLLAMWNHPASVQRLKQFIAE